MKKLKKAAGLFLLGAVGYNLLELAARKRTHISMSIAGGICFLLIYRNNDRLRSLCWWKRCALGAGVITLVELITGWIVNIRMKLKVWDYSKRFANFKGQICLPFCGLWFLLCIPVNALCACLQKKARV